MNARSNTMATTNVDQIRNGWTAYDANREQIGDVIEIGSNYVLVQKGLFFPKDLYIPLSRGDIRRRGQRRLLRRCHEGQR